MKTREAQNKLYEIAESQKGLFTSKQAKSVGYSEQIQLYHVQQGHWLRRHRGIYQLAHFPSQPDAELVLWSLWSRNRDEVPQGVYSHETALNIYELSDVNPSKLHMIVPKSFRRMAATPKILKLHFKNIPEDSIEIRQGYAVVKPIFDILILLSEESVSMDILVQALSEGLQRGLITKSEVKKMKIEKSMESKWKTLLKKAQV